MPANRWFVGWGAQGFAALLLTVAATRALPAAETNQEQKDQIAAGESELRRAMTEKAAPPELIAVRGKLMRLYQSAHWLKKVEEQAKEILKIFTKAALPKNGGPEAAFAAEAQFWLLYPRYDAAIQSKLALGNGGKAAEALAKQIRGLRVNVVGEEVPDPDGGIPQRKGGLCGDYSALVASYRAIEWSVAAAVLQSRLLSHGADMLRDTPAPADQNAEDQAQFRQIVDEQARDMAAGAQRLVEAAWTELTRRNLESPWRIETKRELNRYLPKQHPLSRVRSEKWLSTHPEETQAMIRNGGLIDDLHGCYDRHLAQAPDEMLGEVQAKFTLKPDGTVQLDSVEHADAVVGQCLKRLWSARKDLPRPPAPVEVQLGLELASL